MRRCCDAAKRRSGWRHLHDASPLDAQRVLVDGNDQLVLQDGTGLGADGAQVVGHVEGSGHDGPQRHLGAGLLEAEAEVADNQLQAGGFEQGRGEKGNVYSLYCGELIPLVPIRDKDVFLCFWEAGLKKKKNVKNAVAALWRRLRTR